MIKVILTGGEFSRIATRFWQVFNRDIVEISVFESVNGAVSDVCLEFADEIDAIVFRSWLQSL